jgi:hypothetical protein
MLTYDLVSYQLLRAFHYCVLKYLHFLMVKTVRSSVTMVLVSRPTWFHKAEYSNVVITFKKLNGKSGVLRWRSG